jgi:Zn finger protein HypA/HybF involved in hydrogenase expression
MAYLHCHHCHWQQDDFWHEGYNPLRILIEEWEKDLLEKWLDDTFRDTTYREAIIDACKITISKLRGMKYKTEEEYREWNPKGLCPECGSSRLDID